MSPSDMYHLSLFFSASFQSAAGSSHFARIMFIILIRIHNAHCMSVFHSRLKSNLPYVLLTIDCWECLWMPFCRLLGFVFLIIPSVVWHYWLCDKKWI